MLTASGARLQQAARQLRFAPMLGGVAGDDDQHVAPGDDATTRMLSRAVDIFACQRLEALREAIPQVGPLRPYSVGRGGGGDELARVVPRVRLAAQCAQQVLL